MVNNELKRLYREKSYLLDQWHESSRSGKLKILVKLIDIDDQISEVDSGGDNNAVCSRKRRKVSAFS